MQYKLIQKTYYCAFKIIDNKKVYYAGYIHGNCKWVSCKELGKVYKRVTYLKNILRYHNVTDYEIDIIKS